MKHLMYLAGGLALGASALLAPPAAAETWPNWGQEVKECNHTPGCYPEGSRGDYVSVQARDHQGPGYGWEIHHLVFPGNSDPTLP